MPEEYELEIALAIKDILTIVYVVLSFTNLFRFILQLSIRLQIWRSCG